MKQSVANKIIFDKNGNISSEFRDGVMIYIGFSFLRRVSLYKKGIGYNLPYAAFVRIKLKGE